MKVGNNINNILFFKSWYYMFASIIADSLFPTIITNNILIGIYTAGSRFTLASSFSSSFGLLIISYSLSFTFRNPLASKIFPRSKIRTLTILYIALSALIFKLKNGTLNYSYFIFKF